MNSTKCTTGASREELVTLLGSYLDALRERRPKQLDLSRLVRFTENAQTLPVGLGLWASVEDVAEEPIVQVVDEVSGSIAAIVWAQEADYPLMLTVRLATVDGRLTEVETIASRGTYGEASSQTAPSEAFVRRTEYEEPLSDDSRATRWELARATNLYLESIERGDAVLSVADECVRHENGKQMALNPTGEGFTGLVDGEILGLTVARQIVESDVSKIVERARDRRFVAIDQERGTTAMFFYFDHVKFGDAMPYPNTLYAGEFFKHVNGEIVKIDAGFELVPLGTRSGWES